MFVTHGVPWIGKKAVEMGRYGGKWVNEKWKILKKRNWLYSWNVGSQALDQLPTKIRLNKTYKTDRKDFDCKGIMDGFL